jgi:hypothetical protein
MTTTFCVLVTPDEFVIGSDAFTDNVQTSSALLHTCRSAGGTLKASHHETQSCPVPGCRQ